MKIIKEGKIPKKDKLYTGTCQNCGCEVECEDYERQGIGHRSIVACPTYGCGAKVFLLPKMGNGCY